MKGPLWGSFWLHLLKRFSVKFFKAPLLIIRKLHFVFILGFSNPVLVFAADSSFDAQEYDTHMYVGSIEVVGLERIPKETVLSYMTFKKGESVDRNAIDLSLKALFATELFADVNVQVGHESIKVTVKENPVINRIAFEGNQKLKEERLKNELQLRPRVVYTRSKVQSDVERVVEIYRQNGRYAAKVEPYVIELPQNRVDLVFKIDEGKVTQVHRISFLGNKHFSDARLKEIIKTRESAWWRLLSSDDVYDPHRLEYDKELLREYYLAMGYPEFRVKISCCGIGARKGWFLSDFYD
jgi:outer membrane protein insertion porin family